MKKVVYSVQRVGRFEIPKMSGLGYIVEDNLLISAISQKGKPYIRVFEGVTEYCHKVVGKDDEFKGYFTEYKEVEVEKDDMQDISSVSVESEVDGQETFFEKEEDEFDVILKTKEKEEAYPEWNKIKRPDKKK